LLRRFAARNDGWALKRLDPASAAALRKSEGARETDPAVRAEWEAA